MFRMRILTALIVFGLAQALCGGPATQAPGGGGSTPESGETSEIADIRMVKTHVQAGPANQLREISGLEKLRNNDSVTVLDGGVAQLDFTNQVSMRLFNDTSVGGVSAEILENTPTRLHMKLERGGLSGQVVKEEGSAEVEIANGTTITILGTQFFIVYDDAQGIATVGNFDGKVSYQVPGKQAVPLPPGKMVDILPNNTTNIYDLPFGPREFDTSCEGANSPLRGLADLRVRFKIPLPGAPPPPQPVATTPAPRRATVTPVTPNPYTGVVTSTPGGFLILTPLIFSPIDLKYAELAKQGISLGDPTGPEGDTAGGVGRYRNYQYGSIYWTKDTGAWEIQGAIRDKYASMNWENSPIGYPITDETTAPDGVGRYNNFQYGAIYWSPQTGTYEIQGAIHAKWLSLGGVGFMGYPTSDETPTSDGVGRFNSFQNGWIYWSPDTGAWAVYGAIGQYWIQLGAEQSCFGYPISDEEPSTNTYYTRQSRFRKGTLEGTIYWSQSTGVVAVCPGSIK